MVQPDNFAPTPNPNIAVIVPCFNEEKLIGKVVAGIPDFISHIIVVDDCSTDKTVEKVSQLTDPRLTFVKHHRNQGVGGATLTGYKTALELDVDICVKMDGDGQMAPDYLERLLAPIITKKADYSKGNRFLHTYDLNQMPLIRILGNGCLSFLTKLVSGYWSIFDPTNGYTAIHSDLLREMNFPKINKRYFFETSMLVELNILGAVVADVTMPSIYGEEQSSLRLRSVLLRFPYQLAYGLARRFFWRYMVRDFNALTVCIFSGTVGIVFGTTFGSYHWWLSIATGITATAGTTILAALPILLGFQAILVALVLDMLYQPKQPLIQQKSKLDSSVLSLKS